MHCRGHKYTVSNDSRAEGGGTQHTAATFKAQSLEYPRSRRTHVTRMIARLSNEEYAEAPEAYYSGACMHVLAAVSGGPILSQADLGLPNGGRVINALTKIAARCLFETLGFPFGCSDKRIIYVERDTRTNADLGQI